MHDKNTVIEAKKINVNNNESNNNNFEIQLENLNNKLTKNIFSSFNTKKGTISKHILNCYEMLGDIESKLQQEKLALELLLSEKIVDEKFRYEEEIESK